MLLKRLPGAIGPYSQGFIAGGFVYTSGQIPVNPADGTVPEGIAAQTEQSCKNVGAILEAAGSGYDKVIKTTCFLADIADFAAFNEVYAKYFTSKPARSCVAVKDLPKGCPVRDRGRGRGVSSLNCTALRSPLYNALKLCHNLLY